MHTEYAETGTRLTARVTPDYAPVFEAFAVPAIGASSAAGGTARERTVQGQAV